MKSSSSSLISIYTSPRSSIGLSLGSGEPTGVAFPVFSSFLALAISVSRKGPNEPLSSSTVEASSKLSEEFSDSAEVAAAFGCGGVRNLLITDGDLRAAEVLRAVPLLVVDGYMGTFSQGFPIMDELQ